MIPTPAMQLRDLAGALQAMIEEGEFTVCDDDVETELATWPALLNRIARQSEQAQGMAA